MNFDPSKQAELEALLAEKRNRRMIYNFVILLVVVLALSAGYLLGYKPYADSVRNAMVYVKESEQFVARGEYDRAIQSLNRARIVAPGMKALYYRAGLIFMDKKMQMRPEDYANAEDMFRTEISNSGHVAGAEIALGFLYTIDALIQDDDVPLESKSTIVDEVGSALDLDITIMPKLNSLGLAKSPGYQTALNHFDNALATGNRTYKPLALTGLAYAHALSGSREEGKPFFAEVKKYKSRFPVLAKFYESSEPRLGTQSVETSRIFAQARQLASEGRHNEALAMLEDAKIENPNLDGISYYTGLINLLKMDFNEAIDLFNNEFENELYASKSHIATGFVYTIDGILKEKNIPDDAKRAIIEEISVALNIDIALSSGMEALNLSNGSSYDKAIIHFSNARTKNQLFSNDGSIGLAYIHSLQMNREEGEKYFSDIPPDVKAPILREYYENHLPSMTIAADVISQPMQPILPIDELPSIDDEIMQPPHLPNIEMPRQREQPPWREPRQFYIEPTVKPFRINEYIAKDGTTKNYVTLMNIKESGQTIAREGQTRKMPRTNVEVTVLRISEDRIVINENNLYKFTWERTHNTWNVTQKERI